MALLPNRCHFSSLSLSASVNALLDDIKAYEREHLPRFFEWRHRVVACIESTVLKIVALAIQWIRSQIACIKEALRSLDLSDCYLAPRTLSSRPLPAHKSVTSPAKYLFVGSQSGCNGMASVEKTQSVFDQLMHKREPGITFVDKSLHIKLEGGTCTAMVLDFVTHYLSQASLDCLVQDDDAAFQFKWAQRAINYKMSNPDLRARQLAYNTIHVIPGLTGIDYSLNKMQSLANYHDLSLTSASKGIDILKQDPSVLAQQLDALPKGCYILRLIRPSDNHKLEKKGHTMLYIYEGARRLFYDPNSGLKQLGKDYVTQILDDLLECCSLFDLYELQLYGAKSKRS